MTISYQWVTFHCHRLLISLKFSLFFANYTMQSNSIWLNKPIIILYETEKFSTFNFEWKKVWVSHQIINQFKDGAIEKDGKKLIWQRKRNRTKMPHNKYDLHNFRFANESIRRVVWSASFFRPKWVNHQQKNKSHTMCAVASVSKLNKTKIMYVCCVVFKGWSWKEWMRPWHMMNEK